MVDKLKVEQCIESLCQNGCATVRATITAMEQDISSVPLTGLEITEQQQVLNELKIIMAVYEEPVKCGD